MNINRQWKKWFAVGCSHGDYIDPEAREAALKFQDAWKPHNTIHLGDFTDMAALRTGAMKDPDSKDRAASIADDLKEGVSFLHELKPKHIMFGNHEDRLYKLVDGPNALASHAASLVLDKIDETAKKLKAKTYPYHIRSYLELGGAKFLHGFMYNVQAIRDHAETYGTCVIAHLHRVGMEEARTAQGDTGYCVGMLARFDMGYAQQRRATFAWSQGFAYGHYTDNKITVNLCQRKKGNPWILPL
jgi:predicted phosphodiesterase